MRIIAGMARGRRLLSPGGRTGRPLIRPTSDRARESVFNVIGPATLQEARVLDLFAGTGALGLEALSRGARQVVFVDKSQEAVALIRRNITICAPDRQPADTVGGSPGTVVVKRDLTRGLSFLREVSPVGGFTLVFLDPPYHKQLGAMALAELSAGPWLATHCVVVAEESSRETLPDTVGRLILYDRRQYGEARFWFYHTVVDG